MNTGGCEGLESDQTSSKSTKKSEALSFSDSLQCQSCAYTPQNSGLTNELTQPSVIQPKTVTSPTFQTSQTILFWAHNKDVTDELLCCLAKELLMLEEKDINSSRTKNTGSKMQETCTKEEENMMNGDRAIANSALAKVKVISCNLLVPLSDASAQVWMKAGNTCLLMIKSLFLGLAAY